MNHTPWALALLASAALIACGGGSDHDDGPRVAVAHTRGAIDATPFPSDQFTQADASQATGQRVALPLPDCAVRVSDCQDANELNTLDGFSVWPRFTVPFTGDIDPTSVTSDSIYLQEVGGSDGTWQLGQRIGINQIAWDAASKTLNFKSDALLREHTRHVLVITDRVKDANGQPLDSEPWLGNDGQPNNSALGTRSYREALGHALQLLPQGQAKPVAATLFTTQTATRELARMVEATQQRTAAGLDFAIRQSDDGTTGRAVFNVADIASGVFHRQVGTAPSFSDSPLPLAALDVVPGTVAQVVYARFDSPRYLDDTVRMPPQGTVSGPKPLGEHRVHVQLFVPAGPKPADGWPVVVFGHGFGNSMLEASWNIASVMASHGMATAAIHVVGHGGGPLGTVQIRTQDGRAHEMPVPGRGVDQNGDGQIAATEGSTAPAPYGVLGARDALRQTVVDLSELVRRLQSGVDVDGDGTPDFNPRHITYSGQSFGGVYGTMLLGVNKALVAGVPNVGGGSLIEATRFGGLRSTRVASLAARTPSLINATVAGAPSFIDNIPFRNQPVQTSYVAGALAIAQAFASSEWAQQAGSATAYAPLIRQRPLAGHAPTPIIYQLAKGDTVMMNTSSSQVVRGGAFADRVSWYRHDLALAQNPAIGNISHGYLLAINNPAALPIVLAAQHQVGRFLASQGTVFEDADGDGPLFELGIREQELDGLNFQP